jgi:hypothetical protein
MSPGKTEAEQKLYWKNECSKRDQTIQTLLNKLAEIEHVLRK